MMNFAELASVPADPPAPFTDQLRLAVAAYLTRFKGSSREHTESDLHCYLSWCAERGLDPLTARRPHLELYIRWMQEIRRFKPSTVPGASRSWPGSTALASSTAFWSTHPPSMSTAPRSQRNPPPLGSLTCSLRPCLLRPASPRADATSYLLTSRCFKSHSCRGPSRSTGRSELINFGTRVLSPRQPVVTLAVVYALIDQRELAARHACPFGAP
jgi:hypothetical protein